MGESAEQNVHPEDLFTSSKVSCMYIVLSGVHNEYQNILCFCIHHALLFLSIYVAIKG